MNFLGIGPGELILIMILLLVVVGPERLPGLARQAGHGLVRIRNWLQTSPDAAVVLRARQEIEQELALLKSSLLEVQSVRDEVLGAAKQFNESVSPLTTARTSFADLINGPAETATAANANGQSPSLPATVEDQATEIGPQASPIMASDSETSPMTIDGLQVAAAPSGARTAPTASEAEELGLRLQAVMADLYALQEQLKQRGALDADWQPPSFAMHLPVAVGDTHTDTAPPDSQSEEAD
jgi:sec-independent protein translocase protein TatB